jgi:putative DNA primase/helicase
MATVVPICRGRDTAEIGPFERVLDALRQRGCRIRYRSSSSARSTCPVHHDRNPSLVVTFKDGKVVMKCFAGCRNADIVSTIGLRMADLSIGPRVAARPRQIVAVYSYCDMDGVIDAEKVRLEPKGFWWRVPAPETRDGHRWGLGGVRVGLYRMPELVAQTRIILTEGEKAADRLAVLDLVTTCPPNGASSWDDEWSADLWALGCRGTHRAGG